MNKKIFLFPFLFFLLILFIFFYLLLIERNPSEIPSNLIDKNIPKFKSQSLIKSGEYISQENFKNKITLVNFFASWCKPCRDEHKYIKLLATNENIQIPSIKSKNKINEQSKIKLPPSKKDKEYYVQIASFKNEFNAKKLYKSIKLNNVFLSLEKVSTSNGLFYRIITNIIF